MRRREFLKFAAAATATALIPQSIFGMAKPLKRRPNFVFILIDDMGWTGLSCYGSSFYETPNIDRLAAEGMRFTDAYAACPLCSPTRASIMTGKYPARLKLTDQIGGWRREKLTPAPYIHSLPLKEVTIADALKEAGYVTGFFGKWHLGDPAFFPEYQGFDVSIGETREGVTTSHFYPKWKENIPIFNGKDGEYFTDRLTDESIKFIENNKDRPFFVYLSHYAVHTPIEAKPEYIEKYKLKAEKLPPHKGPRFIRERSRNVRQVQDNPVYAAMTESVDEGIGRIRKKLNQLGIADNTIIIFMSDNGGLSTTRGQPTSNVPLRAGKGWTYEGGIRVPMIIKWPNIIKPGSICNEPVISNDFYPTMLEMAGLSFRVNQHKDGVSLVPLLTGKRTSLNRDAIFWHYPHYAASPPSGAVRCGDYKLIEFFEDNHIELYNLRDDIREKHNLADEMPEKAKEMLKKLHKWRKSVKALMPKPNLNFYPELIQ